MLTKNEPYYAFKMVEKSAYDHLNRFTQHTDANQMFKYQVSVPQCLLLFTEKTYAKPRVDIITCLTHSGVSTNILTNSAPAPAS